PPGFSPPPAPRHDRRRQLTTRPSTRCCTRPRRTTTRPGPTTAPRPAVRPRPTTRGPRTAAPRPTTRGPRPARTAPAARTTRGPRPPARRATAGAASEKMCGAGPPGGVGPPGGPASSQHADDCQDQQDQQDRDEEIDQTSWCHVALPSQCGYPASHLLRGKRHPEPVSSVGVDGRKACGEGRPGRRVVAETLDAVEGEHVRRRTEDILVLKDLRPVCRG